RSSMDRALDFGSSKRGLANSLKNDQSPFIYWRFWLFGFCLYLPLLFFFLLNFPLFLTPI
ncbi:MAG: hypothetical protein KC643_25160, partial [Nitrospira sp.]|nr:hypothetical protein [Nitrospira sp.]